MIPNIFISSTIADLGHLRDSIRDVIQEIGYNPVMSEYGEIGYLPNDSAEDSCYLAMRDCQLAVIIIGKRYGSLSKNGLSVTHNEFRSAKDRKLPIIFLVGEEVMYFKKIYDANESLRNMTFPDMDKPSELFGLIREFLGYNTNNGLVSFSNVPSAKSNLKKQLAHIMGDLLRKQFDPVQGEIKDILTEITTLRHLLLKNDQKTARKFSIAFRFLISEENKYLKELTEEFAGSLEEGIPKLIDSKTLKNFLANSSVETKIISTKEASNELNMNMSSEQANVLGIHTTYYSKIPYETPQTIATLGGEPEYNIKPDDPKDKSVIFGIGAKVFIGNKNAEKLLEAMFDRMKESIDKSANS